MCRMIIVDDREDIRTFVARVARREGYDVSHTGVPEEFVELVAEHKPDIVSVDVIMPGKDGVEILGELASIGFAGRLLLISGYHDEILDQTGKLARAYGLDLAGILTKPIALAELRGVLARTAAGPAGTAPVPGTSG